ncbi:gluzincin family metallopeptidase [Leptothrix discophora]|uniref:Uncharacterized protein n=1 Tax=Leptothrix discophora TaxID=89 RepID=A0ABT9G382_LEPDI|nr:hypothetical protein [Leptothrix discophora]MDP4300943.1 hypothetical protein [Leptothrix discophora]
MISFRDLFGRKRASPDAKADSAQDSEPPPSEVVIEGASSFAAGEHSERHEGYPVMAWEDVCDWLSRIESAAHQSAAWREAKRVWLLHMRCALGPSFRLRESKNVLLLSSLEPKVAGAALDYMERTLQRVASMLDGVARMPAAGQEVMIIFDDYESYYRYVSYYYPNAGEYAFSGGMHIDAGCSHYVTIKADLRLIEPVIAHEMTHGCLGHLPLPAWLNEGLAVNVERRLCRTPPTHTPQQLHARHLAFWRPRDIQDFWSGRSFLRPDDGNLLSYDLARLIVEQLSRPWEPFKQFVLAADGADAGSAAARQYLGVDLGEVVCVLLEQPSPAVPWGPDPGQWQGEPERGRFAGKSWRA